MFYSSQHLKKLAGHVVRASVAGRCHVHLSRVGLRIGYELSDSPDRNRWIDLHDVGHAHDTGHRCDVADEIETELFIEADVDCLRCADQQQRVAIRGRAYDRFCGDIGGSTRSVYHPAILLGLLVYGYTTGVFSSRKLERATYDSVAFRFIAANDHPDHDTIATFAFSRISRGCSCECWSWRARWACSSLAWWDWTARNPRQCQPAQRALL